MKNWRVKVEVKFAGGGWSLDLTSGEQGLLDMLRMGYPALEKQIRAAANARPGALPAGLVDDGLALLRCLVFNRLEPHRGRHVQISEV